MGPEVKRYNGENHKISKKVIYIHRLENYRIIFTDDPWRTLYYKQNKNQGVRIITNILVDFLDFVSQNSVLYQLYD